jgi:AcrR family transcriptional regulator
VFTEGSRAKKKRETRRAILAAAREEFEARGFDGASMRAIASRAGVAAGTVVLHFGGKSELLHAAFFEELDSVLQAALAEPGPAPLSAQLTRLTRAIFGHYLERPALSRTQLKESLFAAPPWDEAFGGQVEQTHETVAGWVEAAVERGELRGDASGALIAASYLSFFYFALLGWARGTVESPAALVASLVEHQLAPWRVEAER